MSYLSRHSVLATLTSFLSYFVMSAIISPLGLVSGALASRYDISLTAATALFSYLTTGVLIGSFLSIFANPRFGSRTVILGASGVLFFTILAMRAVDLATFLPIAFLIIGSACGLLLAAAAIVLTAVYREPHRPSALLATDSFYSFAGFATTPLAGWVIAQSMHWTFAYAVAALVALAIAGIAYFTKYPPEMTAPKSAEGNTERWPPAVFFVGAALFVYLVSFVFVYSWAPAYAASEFGVAAGAAGGLVSRFFLGLFFGQLVMFFLALRVDVRLLLGVVGAGAVLATIGLWTSASAGQFGMSLMALGLVAGGILKPLIAYGAQAAQRPTSRLIGFYMFSTALGSSIAPALGAFIVEQSNIKTVLMATTAGLALTYAFIVASMIVSRRRFAT